MRWLRPSPAIEGSWRLAPEPRRGPRGRPAARREGGARIWVAEEEGEVVGTAAARTVADEVEVLNLGVDPSWRRRGVGRSLMRAALDEAGQAGASRVFLEVRESNAGARAFYAALGFRRDRASSRVTIAIPPRTRWYSVAFSSRRRMPRLRKTFVLRLSPKLALC